MKNIRGTFITDLHLPSLTPYLLSLHIVANSFAPAKNSTLLFSSNSELFAQNTGVWGRGLNDAIPEEEHSQEWLCHEEGQFKI